MHQIILWLYLVNAILLIIHEIDSAYWHEWELFKLKGGITLFLILHFPLLFGLLYGQVLLVEAILAGYIFSLVVSLAGIFAFGIHTWFIKKGRPEFTTTISLFILWATFVVSLLQAGFTGYVLFG